MRPSCKQKFGKKMHKLLTGETFNAKLVNTITIDGQVYGYNYVLDTKVGQVKINVATDKSAFHNIHCQFDDTNKAFDLIKDRSRLNPYSGKYNFHYQDETTAIDTFINSFMPLLP